MNNEIIDKKRIDEFVKEAKIIYQFVYERQQIAYRASGYELVKPEYITVCEDGNLDLYNEGDSYTLKIEYEDLVSSEKDFLQKYETINKNRIKKIEETKARVLEKTEKNELEILKTLYEKHKDKIDWQ